MHVFDFNHLAVLLALNLQKSDLNLDHLGSNAVIFNKFYDFVLVVEVDYLKVTLELLISFEEVCNGGDLLLQSSLRQTSVLG